MKLKGLKRRTTFFIGTFSDSKWILNEKIREDFGFEFN
jgi:hypothetical protein